MRHYSVGNNDTIVILGKPAFCKSRKEFADKYLNEYERVFFGWNQEAKDSVQAGHPLVVLTDSMDNKLCLRLSGRYSCLAYTTMEWKEYQDRKLAKKFINQISESNKGSHKFEDNGDIILTVNIKGFKEGLTSAMIKVLDHFSDFAFVTVYVKLSDITKISRTIKINFCEDFEEFNKRLEQAFLDGYNEALTK